MHIKNLLRSIYNGKWFPRLFYIKPDGGVDSGVTGYFLIEWKILFSIGVLHFKEGSREAYHSHAFNAITWWLRGSVVEMIKLSHCLYSKKLFRPSCKPKFTSRSDTHKVVAGCDSYALTFRGPWVDYWHEYRPGLHRVLTHGRKVLSSGTKRIGRSKDKNYKWKIK